MGRRSPEASPTASGFPLRRMLAMLLLPVSLVPVVLLAPSMVRAPAVLVSHVERFVAPAPRTARRAPYEPWRYPVGASRLERDMFAPVAGPLTPQVGVSAMAEHQTLQEKAHAPILLITGEPVSGAYAGDRSTIRWDRLIGQRRPQSLVCRARFAPCVLTRFGPRTAQRQRPGGGHR